MTGDQADFLARIKALLPNGWFRDATPILDGVLSGIAWAFAFTYGLTSYARLQTRIGTATDAFLDLISFDFLGTTLPRKQAEVDDSFRSRILAELFLERGTRAGLIKALTLLTGRTPKVFEPARPADTGGYNAGGLAYGLAGGYGSLELPFQTFVIAYRPTGQGIPNIAGYGNSEGAYSTGSRAAYVNPSMISGVTDTDIYSLIDSVKPVAAIAWTRIES